jgi:hypothetical protein
MWWCYDGFMNGEYRVEHLSDDELISRTGELAVRGRRVEAALIAHMAEVDRRQLYRGEACSSMFAYATRRLRLSESQAYDRIAVARTSRTFPVVLEMLADGRLTLTAASKLGPHLTRDNAETLLARAVHATRRQVEELVAEVAPQADAPSSIRRVRRQVEELVAEMAPRADAPSSMRRVRPAGPGVASVVPTAPGRYRVQFTASEELEKKIARARALLRHKIPSGDLAAIVDEAMTVLVAKLERRRCAATERPRTGTPAVSTSRHVPAAVRRAVWERDQGRCTFVDRQGRRCEAREWLEIHHDEPFARAGASSLENLRLLCCAHNQYRAEVDYGADFMRAKRSRRLAVAGVGGVGEEAPEDGGESRLVARAGAEVVLEDRGLLLDAVVGEVAAGQEAVAVGAVVAASGGEEGAHRAGDDVDADRRLPDVGDLVNEDGAAVDVGGGEVVGVDGGGRVDGVAERDQGAAALQREGAAAHDPDGVVVDRVAKERGQEGALAVGQRAAAGRRLCDQGGQERQDLHPVLDSTGAAAAQAPALVG